VLLITFFVHLKVKQPPLKSLDELLLFTTKYA